MLEQLLDLLICPACLPEERPLRANLKQVEAKDILEGELLCPMCGAIYPIREGLAELVPPGAEVPAAQARYEQWRVLASYLWSHYADFTGDPEASEAYLKWAEFIAPELPLPGLDTGCAVGRMSFELAARCGFAVGLDLSRSFVLAARKLAAKGELSFDAPKEGLLRQRFAIALPERLRENPVEFVLADAQALPFKSSSFAVVASLNLVDKLPRPLTHLRESQRACAAPGSLVFSDPFSWSEEITSPENWLGGTPESGPGLENVPRLLAQIPGWEARAAGPVSWRIRDHVNRFEHIRSQAILAKRRS